MEGARGSAGGLGAGSPEASARGGTPDGRVVGGAPKTLRPEGGAAEVDYGNAGVTRRDTGLMRPEKRRGNGRANRTT